jgi:hypothetical protein
MLKSLDVMIGLAMIMLALSMAVTVITQFVTTVTNSRGRHLRRGIADMLEQLDPALKNAATRAAAGFLQTSRAKAIATAVLSHPLVSASARRLGSVVHREELTRLLIVFATDEAQLAPDVKEALKKALERNGITNPAQTLSNVRDFATRLEAAHPSMANHVRQSTALLQEARSDFTAKVNSWFDGTIDRVAQRFTGTTRAVTFVVGLLVAATFQVDTINLINRLSADDKLRDAFVNQASVTVARQTTAAAQSPNATPESRQQALADDYRAFVMQKGLLAFPDSFEGWKKGWNNFGVLAGVLLTTLLLSLGAPFWYNALGQFLQLRSVLAKKDDEQRQSRQGTGAAAPTDPGERGNLVAVG